MNLKALMHYELEDSLEVKYNWHKRPRLLGALYDPNQGWKTSLSMH